jgi:hypothetical protein
VRTRLGWSILMLVVLGDGAGCKKRSEEVAASDAGSASAGSTSAGSTSAGSTIPGSATASHEDAGSSRDAAAAAAAFFPARFGEKQGVILADVRGGSVEGIADGTVVAIGEINEASMGSEGESTAEVSAAGKTAKVPMIRLLREESIQRSPDGRFAVLSQIESCGDLCHTVHFLIAADGRRVKLGDGVVDVVVAWKKDGTELAVGSGHLWIVSLVNLSVRTVDAFTAPAYGPDGTLYARDHQGSAFIVGSAGAPRRVWQAPEQEPSDLDEYGADDPDPIRFDDKGQPIYEPEYVGPPDGE